METWVTSHHVNPRGSLQCVGRPLNCSAAGFPATRGLNNEFMCMSRTHSSLVQEQRWCWLLRASVGLTCRRTGHLEYSVQSVLHKRMPSITNVKIAQTL
ncbi:hypothetical protein EYF80_052006 [Liparis tanakae]|uniref:Uncharacterized protein n=1 Tax=Liparis tanakae TaxID=230148 RepID=A0A4Z2FA62_9TELE|nr:hypothetical protein EYF80_052006 [Liparis tanakae]